MANKTSRSTVTEQDVEAQVGVREKVSTAGVDHTSGGSAVPPRYVDHAKTGGDSVDAQPSRTLPTAKADTDQITKWKKSREDFGKWLEQLVKDGVLAKEALPELKKKYVNTEPREERIGKLKRYLDGQGYLQLYTYGEAHGYDPKSKIDRFGLADNDDFKKPYARTDGAWRWLHIDRNIQSWFHAAIDAGKAGLGLKDLSEWGYHLNSTKTSKTGRSWVNPHAQIIDFFVTKQPGPKSFLVCFPFLGRQGEIASAYFNRVPRTERDGVRHMKPEDVVTIWEQGADLDEVFLYDDRHHEENPPKQLLRPDFHVRRTLDQYYHSHLVDSTERDLDQVVARLAKHHNPSTSHETDILTVDQCWLLVLSNHTIITSFPDMSVYNRIEDVVYEKMTGGKIPNAEVAAAFIIEACASNEIGTSSNVSSKDGLFNLFETSLNLAADDQAKAFKSLWTEASDRESTTSAQLTDFRRDIKMLAEVRDIKEELEMIDKVMQEQALAFEMLPSTDDPEAEPLRRHHEFQAAGRSELVKSQIERASNLEEGLNKLLQLKDQRATRQLALSSEKENASVRLFTIITIIFLPLSTMASFFGMNAAEFEQGPVPMWKICACVFPISIFFVVLFVSLGLNYNLQQCLIMSLRIIFERLRLLLGMPQGWLEGQAKKLQKKHTSLVQERIKKTELRKDTKKKEKEKEDAVDK